MQRGGIIEMSINYIDINMLSPIQNNLLQNIILVSKNLVVLQTLRAGYLTELECDNKQETKNFRSGALIDLCRTILESMEPMMEYLVDVQEGRIVVASDQLGAINKIIIDLGDFYSWATEEIKIKNMRMELLQSEYQSRPS